MKNSWRITGPGTRAFKNEVDRTPNYSRFDFLHAYVYGRWPYFYISIATGEHFLARLLGPLAKLIAKIIPSRSIDDGQRVEFADTYHGKVVPLEAARQLVTIREEIKLTNLETIVPYKRARDIIMQNPDHIVALECPCRSSRPEPCLPLDVCLIIGEPFAGFIIQHHPERARWITPAEAEAILVAEHERGHVSHAFFKDVMFDRFY
ncbi:MAG: 4Fe-4S ferredoxin, partial [Anaerolineales bacterium]|nr:4Fe-4S ferredoxin [Anaerolineales bacterium]